MQVAADTQVDELISQLSHLTQPEATGSDDRDGQGGSQTENLIAQVQSTTLTWYCTEYAHWYPDRATQTLHPDAAQCVASLHKVRACFC